MDSDTIPAGKKFLPGTTKRRLTSMRNKEPDERYKLHFDAAIMRKDGITIGEIAEDLGRHPVTIKIWLRLMTENWNSGEIHMRRPGRRPKFTPEQLKELERDMKNPPQHYDLASETWTSRTVAEHAFAKFGIWVPHPSMRRILNQSKTNWPGSAAAMARERGEPYP